MKFSDKVKYKYLQENYGKKHKKKNQYNIMKTIDEMENYLEKKLRKISKSK